MLGSHEGNSVGCNELVDGHLVVVCSSSLWSCRSLIVCALFLFGEQKVFRMCEFPQVVWFCGDAHLDDLSTKHPVVS